VDDKNSRIMSANCYFICDLLWSVTDAAVELLRARSKLFAFNSNNAVLQFLLDVTVNHLSLLQRSSRLFHCSHNFYVVRTLIACLMFSF